MRTGLALGLGLALIATASPARAADRDPWLAEDKALHATVSGALAGGSYAVGAAVFDARGHALLAAAGFTLAIGAGKEALDMAGLGHPSWKDFAWNGIGTAIGLALAWSIDLLVRGVGPRRPALVAPRAGDTFVIRF
ncbi:MAG: hypothetical protein KIT84_12675 [Labilithrix sp.]|nr:hypothetical protein [Labilithrix sp.]MCW5811869.1 hypothetical protein [Labilithrix sp.]